MKKLLFLILNTGTLLATLFLNYLAGTGYLNGETIGSVSRQYPALITPASYAFSIWSLIYLLLIIFVGYQWVSYFKKETYGSIEKTGIWFSLANVANGAWVLAFVNQSLGLSVLLIMLLLFALVLLVLRLDLEIWDAPLRIIVFVWWPICIYTGWIVLASVTNVAVYLKSQGWQGGPLSPELWTVGVLALAVIVYLFLIYTRNMREAALVGAWGFIAIAYEQWGGLKMVGISAIIAAVIVFLAAFYHGMKNQATSPYIKWKKKEW